MHPLKDFREKIARLSAALVAFHAVSHLWPVRPLADPKVRILATYQTTSTYHTNNSPKTTKPTIPA